MDALAYTGGLNYPSILLGDLNDHPTTSNALVQASSFDMHRLTGDDPTTLSKDGNLSSKLPIDHCYVNRRSLEVGVEAKIDPTLRISDHVPVLVRVRARAPKFLVAEWSKPTKNLPPRSVVVPWTATPIDFQSWQEAARQWLEKSHAHPISPKGMVSLRPYQGDLKIQKHLKFRRLLTLQRAALECERDGLNETASASLARKLSALGVFSWLKLIPHPRELRLQVEKSIGRIMHAHHRKLLKVWKTKVKEWHVSDASAYRFLRNPLPSHSVAILVDSDVQVHPHQVERALSDYWIPLKTWTHQQYAKAREALEEHYSFLLPHFEFSSMVLPMHMMDVAKRAKTSAGGLDGWSHQEVAALPMQAWFWFLVVCSVSPLSLLSSVTAIFRRVPISKTGSSVCQPQDVRLIDLFSVLLRLHATAATKQLIPWSITVLHPRQYASRGGVLVAVSGIAYVTELSLIGAVDVFGISVDFEKMFNMLSGLVAAEVAAYMGLSFPSIIDLLAPVACAIGTWKLPMSAAPNPFGTTRGLPQGMATSVLLAELAISPVLWRITRSLPEVTVCAYVHEGQRTPIACSGDA